MKEHVGLTVCAVLVGVAIWFDVFTRAKWAGIAVRTLYSLNKTDYQAFMNSYDVFDVPLHTEEDEKKVNAVYKVLVPLMELGALTKFYIPPLMDKNRATFTDMAHNQELFERAMTDAMGLAPGKTALDIGCGQGLVADMVQSHSGAKVVGINISPEQIAKARAHAKSARKLGETLEFHRGSMNDRLPFPDDSFDAAYIVQASTYAHNFTALMAEVRRVLKPGGVFSDLAITFLSAYDANNSTHVRMAAEARRVGVIPVWRSTQYYLDGCTKNGFTVSMSKHLGHHELMQAATDFFNPLGSVINFLKDLGLVSAKVVASMDRMNEHAKSLIEGDRQGVFTINHWIICQAPLE